MRGLARSCGCFAMCTQGRTPDSAMPSPPDATRPPRWRPGRPNIPPRAAPLPGCATRRTSVGPTAGQFGGRMRLVDIITQASTRANGRKARGAGPPFDCRRLVRAGSRLLSACRLAVVWPWCLSAACRPSESWRVPGVAACRPCRSLAPCWSAVVRCVADAERRRRLFRTLIEGGSGSGSGRL